jgi:PHP family Zn ribbon phosphoesterase
MSPKIERADLPDLCANKISQAVDDQGPQRLVQSGLIDKLDELGTLIGPVHALSGRTVSSSLYSD